MKINSKQKKVFSTFLLIYANVCTALADNYSRYGKITDFKDNTTSIEDYISGILFFFLVISVIAIIGITAKKIKKNKKERIRLEEEMRKKREEDRRRKSKRLETLIEEAKKESDEKRKKEIMRMLLDIQLEYLKKESEMEKKDARYTLLGCLTGFIVLILAYLYYLITK